MKLLFTLCVLFISMWAIAQDPIEQFVQSEPVRVEKVEVSEDQNHIYFSTTYGQYDLTKEVLDQQLDGRSIYKVQLVYTSYCTSPSFDQIGLNRMRCEQLEKLVPGLFENDLIEFELVEQTACVNRKEGSSYFHGIIITCGEKQSEELAKQEMEFLNALFDGEDAVCPVKVNGEEEVFVSKLPDRMPYYLDGEEALYSMMSGSIRYPFEAASSREYGDSKVKIEIKPDGSLGRISVSSDSPLIFTPEIYKGVEKMASMEPAVVDGKFAGSTVDVEVKFSFSEKSATVTNIVFSTDPFPADSETLFDADGKVKSTFTMSTNEVVNTLSDNHWQNIAIVADVTGSMSPFTGQLIVFLKEAMQDSSVKKVLFFNDGDGKPTALKIIGKTGGIYATDANNLQDVKITLQTAMQNGSGGEAPESDMEAVLEAQDVCPECSSIVLIADNYAEIRDFKLLKKVEKPVHVVLCNIAKTVNVDYINIAYLTNGTLHIRGVSYTEFDQYTAENPLVISGARYYIKNGEFVLDPTSMRKGHPVVSGGHKTMTKYKG